MTQGTRGRALDLDGVTHRYGALTAVDTVTLAVKPGEIVALLGPSGCGKTTLLRIIAGFIRQSGGRVLVDGAAIDPLPPNRRNIGIVFQNYALFPHMSVGENVAYGLAAKGRPGAEIRAIVERMLEIVRLDHLRDRLPRQLSGGQQQRVALARALAIEPSILLLDEPFSALDKSLRLDMQIEIKQLQRRFGLTCVMVTHDQDEAMSIADRIAVMNQGRVEQFDRAAEVYDRPATLFVNGFIGTANFLSGKVVAADLSSAEVELAAGARLSLATERGFQPGQRVTVSIRPEHLALYDQPASDRWPVQLRLSLPIGPTLVHDLEAPDGAALKLSEPRGATAPSLGAGLYCGPTRDARPALYEALPTPDRS